MLPLKITLLPCIANEIEHAIHSFQGINLSLKSALVLVDETDTSILNPQLLQIKQDVTHSLFICLQLT